MRRSPLLLFAIAGSMWAQDAPRVRQAVEEVERVQKLTQAGAASKLQLKQAEAELAAAREQQSLEIAISGEVAIEDLTEDQARDMLTAAERRLRQEQSKLDEAAKLVAAGVAARTSLVPFEQDVSSARTTLSIAQDRARTFTELAAMARAEMDAENALLHAPEQGPVPLISHYIGDGHFNNKDLKSVLLAYQDKFDRKMPISARGQTLLHRSLGFDHRGRVDVALSPEAESGKWLMHYLEERKIPYFAFRSAVAGQATAAHIHIGPPSLRLSQAANTN